MSYLLYGTLDGIVEAHRQVLRVAHAVLPDDRYSKQMQNFAITAVRFGCQHSLKRLVSSMIPADSERLWH